MVKNEHYVPRFYLRKFADNDKICAYNICDERLFSTNINKIACKNYFYDIDIETLKKELNIYKEIYKIPDDIFQKECEDIQFIEKALSRLEDNFSILLNKFEKDFTLIDDEEFLKNLFLFLHTQSIRTVGFREGLENIAVQTKNWLKNFNIKNIDYPLELEPEEIAKINQIHALLSLANAYKKALSFFENYNIYIGINNSDMDFIISDNPLTLFFLGFNDICFPVNPRLAIIMQVKQAPDEFKVCNTKPNDGKKIMLTRGDVLKYNVLQQNQTAKYLFGSEKSLNNYLRYMNCLKILRLIKNNGIDYE